MLRRGNRIGDSAPVFNRRVALGVTGDVATTVFAAAAAAVAAAVDAAIAVADGDVDCVNRDRDDGRLNVASTSIESAASLTVPAVRRLSNTDCFIFGELHVLPVDGAAGCAAGGIGKRR